MLRPTFLILTDRLLLRPFVDDDLDALSAIQSRPEVARYFRWEPRSRAEVREALTERTKRTAIAAEGDSLALAAVLRASGVLLGCFTLWWTSIEDRQGEIGYMLHPDHHGRGYASEAVPVLLRLGFEGLGLHRIVGRCDARNTASARLLGRLGMRCEAHHRETAFVKGEWTDTVVYALLASEWAAVGNTG